MANTINFKGIKQVTLSSFESIKNDADKLGYLWLVREPKSESPADGGKKVDSFSIYFGTRRYGENDVFFRENLIKTFGGLLDSEGGFIFPVTGKDFTSIDQSNISDLNGLLLALDAAIKANKDAIDAAKADLANKADSSAVTKNIADAKQAAIDAAASATDEKLNDYAKSTAVTEEINTAKAELEGKIANAGSVKDVTVDGKSVLNSENKVAEIVLPVYGLKKVNDLTYQLTKKVGDAEAEVVEGAVINIPQDQFLKSVSFHAEKESGATVDAPYLKFVWNLDIDSDTDGEQTVTYVPVADLVKTYTAGTAIEITAENGINVKVAVNSEEKKNFLAVETDGLAVRGMDADKTITTEDITIAGGPLANNVEETGDEWPWTDDSGNKIIPSGKSISEILSGLFLKEKNGSISVSYADERTFSAKPTIDMQGGTVEVGTKITSTYSAPTSYTAQIKATVTASEGLFIGKGADNEISEWQKGPLVLAAGFLSVLPESGVMPIGAVATWNGDSYSDSGNIVSEGTNTLKVVNRCINSDEDDPDSTNFNKPFYVSNSMKNNWINTTGKTQGDYYWGTSASGDHADKIYASTNTKKRIESNPTIIPTIPNIVKENVYYGITGNTENSKTITGAYKYFLGYSDNTKVEQFDSASIRALSAKTGWVTKDGATAVVSSTPMESDGRSIVIACPAKYKLSKISNGLGASILSNFDTTGIVSIATGEVNTDYKVYIYPITNKATVEFKDVALSKA